MRGLNTLTRWLLAGEWRAHPMRAFLAVVAIAVGVAMGFAIHLINAAAFNEFSAAVKSIAGQADLQVTGSESSFDEKLYPSLAQRPGVAAASPVLQVQAVVPGAAQSLLVLGVDTLRAIDVSPDLVGVPREGHLEDTLADDTIFLSPAASEWLRTRTSGTLTLRAGLEELRLRVAGSVQGTRPGQRLGIMDIGAAQWRFHGLGQLTRIDLKLSPGVNRTVFRDQLQRDLDRASPGAFHVAEPNDPNAESRTNTMSRAYRVNLTVLALVALFTGAFLVFSTQALSVVRRRSQFALLRVLGLEPLQLVRQVVVEGAVLGLAGAALGIAGGYGLAALVLRFFGGDLGGGYFPGVRPEVQFDVAGAIIYFVLGFGVALLGCLAPAFEAARAAPAVALKSGSTDAALEKLARAWPALACLGLGAALTAAPPVAGLPIFGYLAIALMLIGGIALMPRFAAVTFKALQRVGAPFAHAHMPPALALVLARLANASGQAAIALGGVLSSFALMVAMAIMVASFRVSVDDWLAQVLPADLYARSAASGNTAAIDPEGQRAIAATPGVARVHFLRIRPIQLDPARPPVALLARSVDPQAPGHSMPMVGKTIEVPPGAMPAWVSEAMVDLYGARVGEHIELPVGGKLHAFTVAGVWRDYARQSGAVNINLDDYRRLSGDMDVSDAAIWVARGATAAQVRARIAQLPFGRALEFSEPGEIRAVSLAIFDRSFAVTYLLEAIAIAIGMSGVAATFSAQTLARAKEFGMLRHVGVTRGQVLALLAIEGSALTAIGIVCGFALGFVISLVLVFVVNPQSFHWTMQLHMPWRLLVAVAAALLAASAVTALVSGRYALSGGPIRAVREDW
ncbi:ABC transporter permease [Massilia arenosa]|uniref:ABC transporter permease n=1 Tax=Zemynaea arenosa TaxID=2561931 RepID=A0A4Y9RSN8_9BURK|nr:ABC transporter permease [Massilia arenosa]TFW11311.1 ABC transporter permease [Massilia arenosa]